MKPTPLVLLLPFLLAVSASAATGWRYDANAKTLAELGVEEGGTPWTLACTAAGGALTVSGVSTAGSDGFLDLSLPVADAGGAEWPIAAIGSDAFKNRTGVTRLRFPDSLTKIAERAFQDCSYLESVEFPPALSTIASSAFYRCVRLRTVTPFLPETVTSVGENAFYGCTRLASALSIGYGTNGGAPVAATLGGRAFQDCKALPSVAVGPGVVKLVDNLFAGDTSLTNAVLHDGITSIGSTFNGCTALETVTPFLPASATSVGTYAFQNCHALRGDLFFATNGAAATLGGAAFYNDRAIESVTMGDGVAKIDGNTFVGCTSLVRVRLSETLTTIGSSAFNGCTALETVVPFLPDSVTSIGQNAFTGCSSLRGDLVVATNGAAATVGSGAFSYGRSLSSATFGDGVATIAEQTFVGCSSLTNAVLPANLPSVGQSAFNGCSALETVEPFLPDSVASIGGNAFTGCRSLRNPLSIGAGGEAVSVSSTAPFAYCDSVPSLFVGPNVASLYAFFQSRSAGVTESALREVVFAGKPTWTTATFALNAYQSRFVVPLGDAGWADWLSSASNATPWDDLTAAQRALYAEAYPDEPPARALTKAAPANQWVVSYGCADPSAVALLVAGAPVRAASASVAPAYGLHADVASSLPLVLAAPQYADEHSGRYVCAGYRVEQAGDLGWGAATDFPLADPASPSATFDPGATGQFRFTWLWELAEFAVTFADLPAASIGTVSVSGQNARGFFDAGTTATVTAVPGAGATFLRWLGDVPAGHETDATIRLVMDSSKTLTPVFSANWVYSSGKLTDGYWTLQASGASDAISVSKSLVDSPLGLLDLAKPVEGGGAIISIAANAFNGNKAVGTLTLPDTLASVGASAFYGCTSLEGVVLPDSVTSLGAYAFQNCYALKTAVVGDGVPSIQTSCFNSCRALERVELGDGVESIGSNAFRDCPSLVSVSPFLPAATVSVGAGAFADCGKLAGELRFATGGAAASFGGTLAFYNCASITGVELGAGVTEIPYQTFYGCSALRRVRTGDGVTSFGQSAFQDCTSLETVEPLVSAAAVSLAHGVFLNCWRLGGRLELGTRKRPGTVELTANNIFYNAGIEEAVIGRGVSSLPKQFLMWDKSYPASRLRTIRLDSVSSIGEKAFAACKAVKDVWFKGPAPTTYGSLVYQGWSAGQSVLHLPKYQQTWTDWAAENVTPWDDLTDDQRDLYRDRFSAGRAYGMTTSTATPASQFVVWWDAEAQPTVLIVK